LKLEVKAFESAKLYYDLGNFQSAVVGFETLIKDFPETKRKEEIRYLSIKSNYELARNSIFEKKKERLLSGLEKCEYFLDKYSDSKYINEVNKIMAYSKNELKRFEQ
jgi:outer membrane protein assembly factor BamD